jgi:glycerol uptake facilitator protein
LEAGAAKAAELDVLGGEIPERGLGAYIAEFIGTLILVFFITMVVSQFVQAPTAAAPGAAPTQPFVDWAVIGLVQFFALFLVIQTIAVVSGAHVNPAITIALTAIRQIRPIDSAIFIVMQLLGATLGALLTKALVTDLGRDVHYGAPSLNATTIHHKLGVGFGVETVGTFLLVWAVVGVAINPQGLKAWAALVIGATFGAAVMISGPLTGGSFNPARAFGPDLVSGHWGGAANFFVAYVIAPVIGAVAAAISYVYLFLLPGKKGPFGMRPVG